MKSISPTQLGTYINISSPHKFSIKPSQSGFMLKRYQNGFYKLFGIFFDEIFIDTQEHNDKIVNSFGDDTNINFVNYMKYCEQGFNDNPMNDDMLDLLNAATGLAEEANEVMSVVRKFIFHNKQFSLSDFASEAGDMTWFFANLLRLTGIQLSDVLKANKIKLDHRYPNGRDKNYQLNNRDKNKEKLLVKGLLEKSGAYDKYNTKN